jgi:hypothetical protein
MQSLLQPGIHVVPWSNLQLPILRYQLQLPLGHRWAEVLLQLLQSSCIVALDATYATEANRSVDILGKVVQRFPRDRVSGQRSILVFPRLPVSLELLAHHVSHHNAGVRCSRGVVLLRFDDYWRPKLLEDCLVEVWAYHRLQVMPVPAILS